MRPIPARPDVTPARIPARSDFMDSFNGTAGAGLNKVVKYRQWISGPLMDRLPLHVFESALKILSNF